MVHSSSQNLCIKIEERFWIEKRELFLMTWFKYSYVYWEALTLCAVVVPFECARTQFQTVLTHFNRWSSHSRM